MKTNKILVKQLNPISTLGEQKMATTIKYDDFMTDFVRKIKSQDTDAFSESLIALFDSGELEQIQGNLYKHKNFHILELFERDGIDYSNKMKALDKLNLDITQKYIETINKNGNIFIITQIPGTEKSNLIPLWKFGSHNIPKENKLAAFHDLQKITKAGLTDDKISHSNEMWFVNSEKKIVIPSFEQLRPLTPSDNQKEIMEKYYNILFK